MIHILFFEEFAAVLLDTSTSGLHLSEFHEFVRPVSFPALSDFCIKLTGIQQSFID